MDLGQAVQTIIIDKLKASIIANDMVATRALLNSVRYEESNLLQQTVINIYALDYIVGLNDGIAPSDTDGWTKDFNRLPRVSEIQKWIDAKGLDLNPFAVRANIIKFGTTWYRQGGSNIVTDSINSEAFKKVVELARPELQNKIKKEWQLLFRNNR